MKNTHDILRVGLAGASLLTVGSPIASGLLTSSLILTYLLPENAGVKGDSDEISGLLNFESFRRHVNNKLKLHASAVTDSNNSCFIVTMDVQNFGEINQKYGVTIGQKLLRKIGSVIKDSSISDVGCRYYGDVFVFFYFSKKKEEIVEDLKSMANQLVQNRSHGDQLDIDLVFGLAELLIHKESYTNGEIDAVSAALSDAEVARYIGKNKGIQINEYEPSYSKKNIEKVKLENSLFKSLINNEINLFYQPKFCSQTHNVIGFEALCRWIHPELGFVSPAFFIPLAEETGFIHELGNFVIEESCKMIKLISDNGYADLSCAVNVSVIQFQLNNGENLIQKLLKEMEKNNVKSSQIEIEITESAAAANFDLIKDVVTKLRALGVLVSLDDFGTGESTLYRLKELPVDQVKIDKAFVDDLDTEQGKEVMKAVFHIANALGLSTVAEGVEHMNQAKILKSLGCNYLQGFLLGKPMPQSKVISFLKATNKNN